MSCNVHIFDPAFNSLNNIDWNFLNEKKDDLSQLHPYPARFIESLPRTLIKELHIPNGTAILDPFCGSGTTLVEAQRYAIPSIGVDLNPIACLISRVKTSSLPNAFISEAKSVIVRAKSQIDSGVMVPNIPNLDHWFTQDAQRAIAAITATINSEITDTTLKDALLFSLSSILVRISNQESDTRYAAIQNDITLSQVFDAFDRSCQRLNRAKNISSSNTPSLVINKDVLKVTVADIPFPIGLVITSPPYPNAYEYWLYHKYRMWWLGYDPINVRENEIGARPHYQKKNGQTEVDFAAQMDMVFNLYDQCVIPNGFVCIVIGRSIIKGRHIDNAALITDIALQHKYVLFANIERDISSNRKSFNPSYGKISTENILIFKRGT